MSCAKGVERLSLSVHLWLPRTGDHGERPVCLLPSHSRAQRSGLRSLCLLASWMLWCFDWGNGQALLFPCGHLLLCCLAAPVAMEKGQWASLSLTVCAFVPFLPLLALSLATEWGQRGLGSELGQF